MVRWLALAMRSIQGRADMVELAELVPQEQEAKRVLGDWLSQVRIPHSADLPRCHY